MPPARACTSHTHNTLRVISNTSNLTCLQHWSFDEVLRCTGLFDVSYIVRKRSLGLLGHVVRLWSDVPANLILRICTKTRDGERPSQEWRRACGRPSTTWVYQICHDTGVTATEALLIAEDRLFWWTIATAGGFGGSLCVIMYSTEFVTLPAGVSCQRYIGFGLKVSIKHTSSPQHLFWGFTKGSAILWGE